MPAFSTHFVFAKEMIPIIQKNFPNISINSDAVYLGAQGPDVFFFHRACPWMKGKPLRKIGSEIHRTKPELLFDNMAGYCKKIGANSIVLSYCYGFILHYALDRVCHPYVYAMENKMLKSNKLLNPNTAHNTVELSLDTYIINKELHIKKPEKFNTFQTVANSRNLIKTISDVFYDSFSSLVPEDFDVTDVRTAFKDMKYLQKCLHDEKGILTTSIKGLETIVYPLIRGFRISAMIRPKSLEKSKKYANIYNSLWESPFEQGKHYESFFDLYEKAKNDALLLIKGFNNMISGNSNGKEVTNNISFLTGVEVI